MTIRTQSRKKLRRGWSYAIGAEGLSRMLEGVPQFAELRLSFHDSEFIFTSARKRAIQDGEAITVLSVRYQHLVPGLTGSNQFIKDGWYSELWEVIVYAVPSINRKKVEDAILAAGERVRRWLITPRTDVWRYGRHECSVRVRFSDGTVTFEED